MMSPRETRASAEARPDGAGRAYTIGYPATVPTYTAFLFTQPDGSYLAKVPVLPDCTALGSTRAQALENASEAASASLRERGLTDRASVPREDWSPSRIVWVQDPRTKDLIPYVVMVSRRGDDTAERFLATTVLFPEVEADGETVDQALTILRPRVYDHLTRLVAEKRDFPVQDDQSAYVIDVRIPASEDPVEGVRPDVTQP